MKGEGDSSCPDFAVHSHHVVPREQKDDIVPSTSKDLMETQA